MKAREESAQTQPSASSEAAHSSLDFIKDVTLEVAVEFGRTTLSVGELLKLRKGSVIVFDKEQDAGVDFLVNGNDVAAGEVIVVNENFGVRITSIKEPDFFDDLG